MKEGCAAYAGGLPAEKFSTYGMVPCPKNRFTEDVGRGVDDEMDGIDGETAVISVLSLLNGCNVGVIIIKRL